MQLITVKIETTDDSRQGVRTLFSSSQAERHLPIR